MIAIQIAETGKFLELRDEKFVFEIKNNFFSFNIDGSFSYPSKIPNTPYNRKQLGGAGIMERQAIQETDIEINIIISGTHWVKGLLNVTAGELGADMDIEINIDYSDFKTRAGSKKIRDILDGYQSPSTTFSEVDSDYIYKKLEDLPASPMAFDYTTNISCDLFYRFFVDGVQIFEIPYTNATQEPTAETIRQDIVNTLNAGAYSFQGFVKNTDLFFCPPNDSNSQALFIRRAFVKYYTDGSGLIYANTVDYNFTNVTEKKKIIPTEIGDICFPTIYNTDFWDKKNTAWNGYLNVIDFDGAYKQSTFKDFATFGYPSQQYAMSAQIRFTAILDKIFETAGYTHTGIFQTDSELQELLVYNTVESIYATAQNAPDMTAEKFIDAICQVFCLSVFPDFERKNFHFIANKAIIAGGISEKDWTDKAYMSIEQIDKKKNYILKYKNDDNLDNAFLQKNVDLAGLSQSETIETEASSLKIGAIKKIIRLDKSDYVTQVAEDRRKGNSENMELGTSNSFPLKLLFWRGLQEGGIPMASASGEFGDYSLEWVGEKGLYEIWWKDYLNFMQKCKTAKFSVLLNIDDARMLIKRPYTRIRYNNTFYLIKSVRVQVENSPTPFRVPAEVELVKIP